MHLVNVSKDLIRTPLTWLTYAQLSLYGYFVGAFGPAQPLLRSEQHTSYTIASLHGTALALGAALAGVTLTRVVHRIGYTRTLNNALHLLCVGVLICIVAKPVVFTLPAAFICGFAGSFTVMVTTSLLRDAHGSAGGEKALAEANVLASFTGALGTTLVGVFAATQLGWRAGLLLIIVMTYLLHFFGPKRPELSHEPHPEGHQSGNLPIRFWIGLIGVIAAIGSEFATSFWAAALIRENSGTSASLATLTVMVLLLTMGVGRYIGSVVMHRISLDFTVLITLLIALIGFFIFWSGHTTWQNFIGLGLIGLGLSVQYPLGVARLFRFIPGLEDHGMGKVSIGAGIAIGGAPLILGALGDRYGVSTGYLFLPILLAIALISLSLSRSR